MPPISRFIQIIVILVLFTGSNYAFCQEQASNDPITKHYPEAANSGCMKCHAGIELIREPGSQMLEQIMALGKEMGDPAGCVVCHGGDPTETKDKQVAHSGLDGQDFYPAPASPWVNEQTCGRCHPTHVEVQWTSLMMTEAGKIQGVCWAFGGMTGYKHRWANYAVKNPEDSSSRLGTPRYREYMDRLTKLEPNVFVPELEALPEALQVR